ncbi:S9 family peptidase [Halorhabdus sp. CUG00001]|uniref:alpha/beta hydrolase family protein n=1 Tax=Halorhabdus sp. CUG00001 TaxID=2600297 RepID=UPI00131C1EF9|nr:alpha/beta fold hydrolase [Halorhabdus sp. CUG00001]
MRRRRFLQVCGTLPTVALTGCTGTEERTADSIVSERSPRVPDPSVTTTPTSTRTTATTDDDLPPYADADAYTAETRSIEATEHCDLGATLTIPDGEDTAPGVVIVHGSGPSDRNGTVGAVQLYRDLAVGLASRGIAVLRYEKRTYACPLVVDATELTIDDEVTDDALAAVDRLRNHDRVAAGDVVVAGHSLGGMLAPRIARRDPSLAGIAMLAPPARSLATLIASQRRYAFQRDGPLSDSERERLERIESIADRARAGDVGENETVWGGGRPYWRSLAAYDQVATARKLDVPMLIQQGSNDVQVPPDTELSRWRDALGDRSSVTIQTYEGVNHLLTTGPGPLATGTAPESGHVTEPVVADLAAWSRRITR